MNAEINSFIDDFNAIVADQPDQVALLDQFGRVLTYQDCLEQIIKMQAVLLSIGIKPGETIITLLPNSIDTIILFLACMRGGYRYAPLPCTSSFNEIRNWKDLTGAMHCLYVSNVNRVVQEQLSTLDWQSYHFETIQIPAPIEINKVNALKGGQLILGSSGSTGKPKAMVIDIDRLWSSGKAFLENHQIQFKKLRFWNYLPMSYLGGLFNLTLIPLAARGSVLVDDAFTGKTFLVFWPTVNQFNITCLWLVPTIVRGLLTLATRTGLRMNKPNVQYCFLGTAPISVEEKNLFYETFDIQPLENYGLSETTFISSEHIKHIFNRKAYSVGGILPNIDVKLIPHDESEESFEIGVRTPYLITGYLNQKGVSPCELDNEGYFRTGDFGFLANGQLHLTGRKRDIIKKGGILVLLREIEMTAESLASIAEAIAVKVAHTFYGESYELYIRSKDKPLNEEEFLSRFTVWLHDQLARHKWPEKIILCEDFPRTMSGKVQKHLLTSRSELNV